MIFKKSWSNHLLCPYNCQIKLTKLNLTWKYDVCKLHSWPQFQGHNMSNSCTQLCFFLVFFFFFTGIHLNQDSKLKYLIKQNNNQIFKKDKKRIWVRFRFRAESSLSSCLWSLSSKKLGSTRMLDLSFLSSPKIYLYLN